MKQLMIFLGVILLLLSTQMMAQCNGITINTQASDQSICEGDDAAFSVDATGNNLSYQWQQVCPNEVWTTYSGFPTNINDVRSVYVDNGVIYVATFGGGIATFDTNNPNPSWNVYNTNNGLPSNQVRDVYVENGVIYAATTQGLATLDTNDPNPIWNVYTSGVNGLPSNDLNSVYVANGVIYAGTDGGLATLDLDIINNPNQNWIVYSTNNGPSGFPSNEVASVYVDNGVIYAGTSGGGLAILDTNAPNASWIVYSYNNGLLPSNQVPSVYVDNGVIYAAAYLGGLATLAVSDISNPNASWNIYNTNNGLPSNQIRDVYLENGVIYAATNGGIATLDTNDPNASWNIYNTNNGLPNDFVRSVYVKNGVIYAVTAAGLASLNIYNNIGTDSNSYTFSSTSDDQDCTYQVVITDGLGCTTTSQAASITINQATTESYQETVCFGQTTFVNLQQLGPGNHTQTLINAAGCDSTLNITIDELPQAIGSYQATVCPGETLTINLQEFGPGNHTQILAGASAQGCDSIVNILITNLGQTKVHAGTYGPLCDEDESIILGGYPQGGIWTGIGVIDNSDGTYSFDPAGGNSILQYTVVDAFGCQPTATVEITVDPSLCETCVVLCPSDITVNCNSYAGEIVTWNPPAFQDPNCLNNGSTQPTAQIGFLFGNIFYSNNNNNGQNTVSASQWIQTNGPPSGSLFSGNTNTTIAYTYNAGGGRIFNCEFQVTVNPCAPFDCVNCPADVMLQDNDLDGGEYINLPAPSLDPSCGINDCSDGQDIPGFTYVGNFNGSQYYLSNNNTYTWMQARNYSIFKGGHLVTIDSALENDFLFNALATTTPVSSAWIGLTDKWLEGNFVWDNGDPLSYTNWDNLQADLFSNQDYVQMQSSNGKWEDFTKFTQAKFFMEIPCGSSWQQVAGPSNGSFMTTGTTATVDYQFVAPDGTVYTCSYDVTVDQPLATPITTPNPANSNRVANANINGLSGFCEGAIFCQMQAAPNPTNGLTQLTYYTEWDLETAVIVYNSMGKQLSEERYQNVAGRHTANVDLSNYATGLYIVQIQMRGEVQTLRVMKTD